MDETLCLSDPIIFQETQHMLTSGQNRNYDLLTEQKWQKVAKKNFRLKIMYKHCVLCENRVKHRVLQSYIL